MSDVAILGAGLLGRLIAWRLAGQAVRITLFERGDPEGQGSAAWVAAGMITPLAEAVSAEPEVVAMGRAALALWPQWLAELPRPVFFQRAGSLVVHHPRDREEMTLFRRRLAPHTAELAEAERPRLLDRIALGELEPELAACFAEALLLPGEGQLDGRALLAVLREGLESRGVDCHWHTPIADDALPDAQLVIDCRGLGARAAVPRLRGVRGEVARVHAPEVSLGRPVRLLHPRYPLYVVPKPGRHFVIGATEIESDDDSPVSVRSALELLSAAMVVHPGFAEARILELAAGLRPALSDHRPAIQLAGPRLLRVNGLYRHGYLLAPLIAGEAAALAGCLLAGGDAEAQRNASLWPNLYRHAEMPWTSGSTSNV
ncbi:MAG TPA: FAD-dependent oxidoreductase [Candidatus Competibacteraceae bacterium]|nr:FAD-dependent oxidoreductase [Candidatus Competibacteraceae bacterium]